MARQYGFSITTPVQRLSEEQLKIASLRRQGRAHQVRYTPKSGRVHEYKMTYEGVIPNLERRFKETDSDYIRSDIERYMAQRPCPTCDGARLKPEAAVTVVGRPSKATASRSPRRSLSSTRWRRVGRLSRFAAATNGAVRRRSRTAGLGERQIPAFTRSRRQDRQPADRWAAERTETLTDREFTIARQILKEIRARLGFLVDVGLDYLTSRSTPPARSPAARPSGSGWRRRSAPA